MKKLILSLILSTGLYANMATVDCTEMSKIMDIMQGITKVCTVDTEIHTFTQKFDVDGSGTVIYENGEQLVFMTTNKTMSMNIEADRPFVININGYTSPKFKLSILSTGAESWKYFYEDTRRWRKYSFDTLITDDLSNEEAMITRVEISSRIVQESLEPFNEGIKVQLITDDGVYNTVTDTTGTFKAFLPIETPFTLQAWNILSNPNAWSAYVNKIQINENLVTIENVDGVWTPVAKDFVIHSIVPTYLTDVGTTKFKHVDTETISFTPTDASITNQGVRMIIPATEGKEVSISFITSHRISLWISNRNPVKMLEPNKIIEAGTYTTTVTALGEISVYFAPKEQTDYTITNINIK